MNIESFSTIALSGNMAASGNTAASANTAYSFKINMPSKDKSLCNFKPCFVIPVYNHGAALASVVQNLCYCGIPMILVDDGNDSKNRELILSASKLSPLCILLPLKKNSGKGKAFFAGVEKALSLGFTHVFQIDADGQHDSSRCAFFLGEAEANPEKIICGYPEYDESVPLKRKNGREISNRWARFVTWDSSIKDVLCGYRVYPSKALQKLIKSHAHINARMGFDTDILVHLSWAGWGILNYGVRVTYPQDGISNFRMVRDNIAISLTYTRLCIGMIVRIPKLLLRRIFRG